MRPAICKTNLRVHVPVDTEDCEFWLVYVENINMVDTPDRNHGYLDSDGVFWIWNGQFYPANGVYWGNIQGDLVNQTDLAAELEKAITGVRVNGIDLTKTAQKVDVNVPITSISKNGTPLTITNHNVNITLSEYALLTDLPTKLSDLENDQGFDAPPTKLSELENDIGLGATPTKVSELQNDSGYITQSSLAQSLSYKADKTTVSDISSGLATTNARIDNLASLSEGSTTGDAELIDIRTGYDGTVYSNAGNAVRRQVEDLASFLYTVSIHRELPDGDYTNQLNNDYVWLLPKKIEKGTVPKLEVKSRTGGNLEVIFFSQNSDGTYAIKLRQTVACTSGVNSIEIDDLSLISNYDTYIGLYSKSNGISYVSSGNVETVQRCNVNDVSDRTVFSESFSINFAYKLTLKVPKIDEKISEIQSDIPNVIIVDQKGNGKYTNLLDAMNSEPEDTVIYVYPGTYEQDMTACLKKRVVIIGTDRNDCIIKCSDGRYGHHPLYVSCGYFENLTIIAPYENGISNEIGESELGAYAVHVDTDNDYAIGKYLEFNHCTIKSDFFPAMGIGLRKDCHVVLNDCYMENNQISGRGDYSDEGTLGALYFHDSNGEQGNQYITVKDSVLKSKLGYSMCMYQVARNPQNNHVFCEFIRNVLYDETNGYSNTVWLRGNPLSSTTGIYKIDIGYGNSTDVLNN